MENITSILGSQDSYPSGPSSLFGFSLGDGSRIRFWRDEWIEGVVLKDAFPRIFALAMNKCGKVKDFGVQSNNEWQ